jgi:predicted DNA-binding transcriptional regulator AlpA
MQDLLTEIELSPLLRIKVKTLQQWRQLKRGPRFVRIGRRVFYQRSEIERFIAKNIVQTDSGCTE